MAIPGSVRLYVLHKYVNRSPFQHVGISVSAEGSDWLTAAAGRTIGRAF
jgi:hypothetical protein